MTTLLCRGSPTVQTRDADSFIGGHPILPSAVERPACSICHAELTFFLQLAFPASHAWAGHSIAVFACTACADENSLIPEMLQGKLAGADVPKEFLQRYARNFRTFVFETNAASLQHASEVKVEFAPLEPCSSARSAVARVGGTPRWVLEDEAPRRVAGSPAVFLFQLRHGLEFKAVEGAPPQMDIGLDGSPEPGTPGSYILFNGNEIYFFGPTEPSSEVYILTQVD